MPILTRIPISGPQLAWLIPLFLLCGIQVPSTAQCTLSCNQGLQVSLDPTGQTLITPLMIAPNSGNSCPGPLTISLYNSIGQPLPNPLTCDQIGQVVTAKVRHTGTGNFCNGTLELQDALSPTLSNCGDQFVFCNEDSSPNAVGIPLGTDNCTAPNDLIFNHFDTETSFGCGTFQNGKQVLKRIDRNWTVKDAHGNSNSCVQKIWLKHISFADVSFPLNHDNIGSPALVCGQDPEDLDLTGAPSVNGVPVGASPECEIAVSYTDQTIFHCAPAGFTVLRNWTAIDFCTGTFTNRIQIIKVEDKVAPILIAPDSLVVGTDGFYCTGTVTLPQAIATDNCSAVTVTPSWEYGNGFGPFSGVTEGEHLVTYTATDDCGNASTDTMVVTVVDNSPPQAICSSDLQISLSNNGVGYVNASTIDAGSYDNCGPVFLSISRDEINYTPQVAMSCQDQGAPILLTLKVTDVGGVENFCQMEVNVKDFLKPTVQCPANLTLNCLQDYTDLGLTGQASATDNCGLQNLVYQDVLNLQPCNIGSVTRWWIATDLAANTKSCSQQITVNVVNSTTVSFPADISIPGCGSPASLLPAATGAPVIGGQSCSPLSVNYTDQIFNIAPPSCFRVFRSWKVIDHCIYNPNGGSAGVWEKIQIIDVVDHTPPELIIPADLTLALDPATCLGLVVLPDVTVSDCSNQISVSNNSAFSGSGNTVNASGQYPAGMHLVTFSASDGCGNMAQKTLRITVKDQTPPIAVCLSGTSVQIQATGDVMLDPQQFDGGCKDLCSPQNSLEFSIAPASFDCQQIGLQQVTLSVMDTAGNIAACSTFVSVLDNGHFCGGGGIAHQIEGTIRIESGAPVHNIPVSITGDGFFESTATDTLGKYGFSDIPTNESYVLVPENNSNWLNGVTTYDLVLISKHIVGTEPLTSPYKILAADANHSGSVTTFDVVQLRKVILGILDSLPNNTSWRFVDSSFVFPDPQNPFASPLPESISYDPLTSDQFRQSFIGVKVGDVNGTTNPTMARAPQDTLFLRFAEQIFKAGESMVVPIQLENWSALEGLQFELKLDPTLLEIERIESARPELLGPANIALKSSGSVAVSWDNALAVNALPGNDQIIRLQLRAKSSGNLSTSLQLGNTRIAPEAYDPFKTERSALALRADLEHTSVPNRPLVVNPNPTTGAFSIQNPFAGAPVSLRLFDPLGQVVFEKEGIFPETISISGAWMGAPGLYFIELKNDTKTLNGKVLVVK